MISQEEKAWNEEYLGRLRGKVFKIIPLIEEGSDDVYKYVCSLTFQVSGLKHVISGLEYSHEYIDLWSVLEETVNELISPNPDTRLIRGEILRVIKSIDRLQKGEIK